jgi:hypothetical protein
MNAFIITNNDNISNSCGDGDNNNNNNDDGITY